jgi:molecular chaperone GrpE
LTAQSRLYSDAAAPKQSPTDAAAESTGKDANQSAEQTPTESSKDLSKELEEKTKLLEAKDKEIVSLKDQYLRQVADYRNLQERTKRDMQAARDFGLQRFCKDLMDSIDNLERALHNTPAEALEKKGDEAVNKDLINLHSGLTMTEKILMQTLQKHGLVRFDPAEKQEKFDPNLHEAMFHAPQPDKENGTVFHTQQKGFMLNGRVLRAAKVGVVKNA